MLTNRPPQLYISPFIRRKNGGKVALHCTSTQGLNGDHSDGVDVLLVHVDLFAALYEQHADAAETKLECALAALTGLGKDELTKVGARVTEMMGTQLRE